MRQTCLQSVPARHYIFARLLIKGRVHHFEIGKLLTILWIIREILNRTCRGELLYLGYPNLCQKSLIYTKRDLYTRYHTGDIHKTPKKVTCCSASLYPSHSKCVRRDLNIIEWKGTYWRDQRNLLNSLACTYYEQRQKKEIYWIWLNDSAKF